MENKKNNATEKVENLTRENKEEKSSSKTKKSGNKSINGTKTAKSSIKNGKNSVKNLVEKDENGDIKTVKEKAKYEGKKEKEAVLKKERIKRAKERRAQKEEKEKLKKQRKAEIKKSKKAKAELVKKKKEEYRLEKLRKKEERIARRDMLKHESKEERKNRIAAEKEALIRAREAKMQENIALKEQKAALRRQKMADKRALKEQKRELRAQSRREKRSRGIGGWLAAVISLASVVLVLGTLFALNMFGMFGGNMKNDAQVAETYYDLVDYVGNMDVNMSKLLVSNDEAQQQKILTELSTQASLAASDMGRLPIKDEGKYYTTKFINQVADYAKYLNNRLIDGHSLTEKDYENLKSLYEINNKIKSEFALLSDNIGENFDFNTILDDNGDNLFIEKFVELESNAVEYPKLIYDGPFSDALDEKEVKGLSGEDITTPTAQETFSKIFSSRGVKNVEVVGEGAGKIHTYNVEADTEAGMLYAALTKKGGKLLQFNHYMDCSESNFDMDSCVKIGNEFLRENGLDNMKAVWATESEFVCYVNYCFEQNGVVVYPDMIKLTVCKERGEVSGFDATSYYLNHTVRKIGEAQISVEKAEKSLSTNLDVEGSRLVVIPKGETQEVLAYEFMGTSGGTTYYVYVDAVTGKEVQIFSVVKTTEGTYLL